MIYVEWFWSGVSYFPLVYSRSSSSTSSDPGSIPDVRWCIQKTQKSSGKVFSSLTPGIEEISRRVNGTCGVLGEKSSNKRKECKVKLSVVVRGKFCIKKRRKEKVQKVLSIIGIFKREVKQGNKKGREKI